MRETELLVTYPDDEFDLSAGGLAAKELKGASDVHGADLVHVFILGGVPSDQEVEHTVQLLLLDRLDLHGLEDLSWALLQFFHL